MAYIDSTFANNLNFEWLYTIGGLDWWTGLVDWTTGLIDFHLKRTFRGFIMSCNGVK